MTIFTLTAPVEIDLDHCLPNIDLHPLLREVNRRLLNNVYMTKAQFGDLADAIIEMRFNDAFELLHCAAPWFGTVEEIKQRQLDHILARADEPAPQEADNMAVNLDRINEITKAARAV